MKNDFTRWASAPPSWAAGSELGPVLSSRIRIARNLGGLSFPHNATVAVQKDILQRVFEAVPAIPSLAKGQWFGLSDLATGEREFLRERHLISHQHAREKGERGLVVVPGELVSIMVNEEDHLRAALFRAGAAFDELGQAAAALDEQMSARLPLAFHESFGFATACPTNMGTGLRVSCLMHLPAIVMTNRAPAVLGALSQAGLTVRGFYGEGTLAAGDLFQISNAFTLGRSETQIVKQVEKAIRQVVAIETKESGALFKGQDRRLIEDRIYRAFGTLSHARLLDHQEGMRLLSLVRFGLRIGLPLETTADRLNDLVFLTQSAHLQLSAGKSGGGPEAALRAETVRNRLVGRRKD